MEQRPFTDSLRIAELLKKQFTDKLELEEQVELKQWLDKSAENHKLYDQLQDREQRELWLAQMQSFDSEAGYKRVMNRSKTAMLHQLPARKKTFPYRAIAAAVILLVVAFSSYFWWLYHPSMTHVSVAMGERQELVLPDGSTLFLNAGTELSYPERFIGAQRKIQLSTGEAFFEVTPDQNHPFIIQTDKLAVRVLGTSFNVKTYREDPAIEVTVKTGRVQVANDQKQIVLLPEQQALWDKSTQIIQRKNVSLNDIAAWRENRLLFENETLAEVFRVLQRHYAIAIEVQNLELLNEHVSLEVKDEPLEAVMDILSFTKQFAYEINENQLTIK